jgi:S-adenosylmethionine hydrolase
MTGQVKKVMCSGPIVLLTDFGDLEPYVGQMKGVIAGIAPFCQVVDLCHKVPARRIDLAAFYLEGSIDFFPAGSVFVAVVDPGVGTARRPIILFAHRQYFVGPDNGIFFPLVKGTQFEAVQIENPKYRLIEVGSTFHGRDIFAPAAAYLVGGAPIGSYGRRASALAPLVLPKARREGDAIRGEIIHIDTFGNAWTNISKSILQEIGIFGPAKRVHITAGRVEIDGLSSSYLGGTGNAAVAVINSFSLLEIAYPGASAVEKLDLKQGLPVQAKALGR